MTRPHGAMLLGAAAMLGSGSLLYLFFRPQSLFALESAIAAPWSASLPSFLHTLGIGLMLLIYGPRSRWSVLLIAIWCAVALSAEFLQRLEPPKGLQWYFDPADVSAILLASTILAITTVFTRCKA